jgi:hypothetical protein
MQRAQQRFVTALNVLLTGLILVSGFSMAAPSPVAAQTTDPSRCPVDVTFVIDNSGSMDDNGADVTLKKRLVPNLKTYFAAHATRDDRAALFTFSYNSQARKHVDYSYSDNNPSTSHDSVTESLNRISKLGFGADGSVIGAGIRAALDYAEANEGNRAQFIFVAGDEQTDSISQALQNRIVADRAKHIKFYTFALRSGISDQPYKKIATLSDPTNPRFYKANGFQSTLSADLDNDACGVVGDQQPSVQFCTRDASTQAIIGGALLTSQPYFLGNPPNTDAPNLLTGGGTNGDGCTNPGYLDYTKLTANGTYSITAQSSANGYDDKTVSWTYLNQAGQVVFIPMMKSACASGCGPGGVGSTIVNVTKQANPAALNPGATATTVSIAFTLELINNKAVTNTVLQEQLSDSVSFDATQNFKLTKPDNTTQTLLGTPDATRKKVSLPLGTLSQAGLYTVTFAGKFVGVADDTDKPVDVTAANSCATATPSGSRFEFTTGGGSAGCVEVPAGTIRQSGGNKITLAADVLFGNKALILNNQLVLGSNGNLIVTGQTVTGNTGNSIVFDRNTVPTDGKLAWNAVKTNIRATVDRWVKTNAVKIWQCPGGTLTLGSPGVVTTLYLNTDKPDPTQPPTAGLNTRTFTMWQLKNPASTNTYYDGCTVEFRGPVLITGTGTLVNKGGQLLVHDSVAPSAAQSQTKYALGYVGLQQPGVADSGKVVIYDQAGLTGAIIYTEGTLELGTIDPTVTTVAERVHKSAFIGQTMKFPSLKSLRSSITVDTFAGKNAFPPFVQTYLPKSELAP